MTQFVDLSHRVESGMAVYPGLPSPRIEPYISHAASRSRYANRAEFEISRLFMVGNTGTYLDSPYHRFRDGVDIAGLPLASLAGLPGVCLEAPQDGHSIILDLPPGLAGHAVLVRTGWDRRWGSRHYWARGPHLAGGIADRIVDARIALVGVDFWNIDDTFDVDRPAHTRLLAAGIPIVEHLARLDQLPTEGFRFFAVPAPIGGVASMPVRAFAEIPDER